MRAFSQRSARMSAIVPKPTAAVSKWMPPPSVSVRQKRSRKWSCTSPVRLQPEQILQLVEHEQAAGAGREAEDHRVRDVAGEVAEPQQGDAELDRADHEGEQHRGLDLRLRAVDHRDRGEHRDRDRVGGAVDELARRVEDRADGGHHDRGVEPVLGRQPGDHRVRHRLRDRDRRDRDAGEEVGARVARAVAAQRIEGREEAVEARGDRIGGRHGR